MADVVLKPTVAYRTPRGQANSVREQLARLVLGKSYKECTESDLVPERVTENARKIRTLTLWWPEREIDRVTELRDLATSIAALVGCPVSNFFI